MRKRNSLIVFSVVEKAPIIHFNEYYYDICWNCNAFLYYAYYHMCAQSIFISYGSSHPCVTNWVMCAYLFGQCIYSSYLMPFILWSHIYAIATYTSPLSVTIFSLLSFSINLFSLENIHWMIIAYPISMVLLLLTLFWHE